MLHIIVQFCWLEIQTVIKIMYGVSSNNHCYPLSEKIIFQPCIKLQYMCTLYNTWLDTKKTFEAHLEVLFKKTEIKLVFFLFHLQCRKSKQKRKFAKYLLSENIGLTIIKCENL